MDKYFSNIHNIQHRDTKTSSTLAPPLILNIYNAKPLGSNMEIIMCNNSSEDRESNALTGIEYPWSG